MLSYGSNISSFGTNHSIVFFLVFSNSIVYIGVSLEECMMNILYLPGFVNCKPILSILTVTPLDLTVSISKPTNLLRFSTVFISRPVPSNKILFSMRDLDALSASFKFINLFMSLTILAFVLSSSHSENGFVSIQYSELYISVSAGTALIDLYRTSSTLTTSPAL